MGQFHEDMTQSLMNSVIKELKLNPTKVMPNVFLQLGKLDQFQRVSENKFEVLQRSVGEFEKKIDVNRF